MKRIFSAAALLLALAAAGQAPPDVAASFQRMLNDVIASPYNYSPGVVMRVHLPGRWTWSGAAGTANLANRRPAGANDRYRIGSISKSFTAVAILKLASQNRLKLGDPITKHLPLAYSLFIPNAAQITVRQCLNHTSGLAEFVTDPGIQSLLVYSPTVPLPAALLYAAASRLPPQAPPGGDSSLYSNTNYLILKDIVEKVSGQPYPVYVRNNILQPAGLSNTFTSYGSRMTQPYLSGYLPLNNQLVDYSNANYDWAMGLGEIISNAADQTAYFEKLFTGALIPPRWVDSMANFNLKPSNLGPGLAYGFGVWTAPVFGGCTAKEHGGDVFGWSSLLTYFPDRNAYVSINFNTYEVNGFRYVLRALVCNALNGELYRSGRMNEGQRKDKSDRFNPLTLPLPLPIDGPEIRKNSGGPFGAPVNDAEPVAVTKVDEGLQVFPVPTTNHLTVRATMEEGGTGRLEVLNVHGQAVINRSQPLVKGVNHLQLDVSALPRGEYLLRIGTGKEKRWRKLIVL